MKKIHITETVLRDANQSLMATRMPTSDMQGILETLDRAGYYSLECWGGATFDSCLRYLDEDPWERLRIIKRHVKKTPLQMLLRGQNILGYKHYPDDIVEAFVAKSVENGIDILRVFDALNDFRNIESTVRAGLRAGAHVSGALCYTISPIHTPEAFVNLGLQLRDMGCHSICVKDMGGILSPQACYDLVAALRARIDLPLVVHTHCTTGMGAMTAMKAIEAGADVIDCAIACFSGGTSQPPTETLYYSLREMGFDAGLDSAALKEINDYFKPLLAQALESGILNPIVMMTEPDALTYQVPGGMLSNLVAQLSAQKALDRLPEVLDEVPRVRRDLGYPPLVTPSSQMVGVQATNNVLAGQRYKNITREIKAYLGGEYGQAPGPVDPQLQAQVLEGRAPVTGRYADLLEPGFEKARAELGALAESDEDVLSYAAFPAIAEQFLTRRQEKRRRRVRYTIERI